MTIRDDENQCVNPYISTQIISMIIKKWLPVITWMKVFFTWPSQTDHECIVGRGSLIHRLGEDVPVSVFTADQHGIYSMVIHNTKCLPCETT